MNTLELDNKVNALILEGKNDEAFLTYYDENVVAQENDEPERHGREPWMNARRELAKNIVKQDVRLLANAANGDVSFSEWDISVEIKGMGAMRVFQVAVRRWRNGRIIRERFYHK
jgi:hypothetical protein